MTFLYNDLQIKKPKKLPVLSYLYPDVYKWKAPVALYNNNTHINTHVNTKINTYIKNKLL
jgi:hypothetical protein